MLQRQALRIWLGTRRYRVSKQQPGVVQLQLWSKSRFGVAGGEKQGPGLEVEAADETNPSAGCFGGNESKQTPAVLSSWWGFLAFGGSPPKKPRAAYASTVLACGRPLAGLFCTATIAPVPTSVRGTFYGTNGRYKSAALFIAIQPSWRC